MHMHAVYAHRHSHAAHELSAAHMSMHVFTHVPIRISKHVYINRWR